jgi:hypothetical protein
MIPEERKRKLSQILELIQDSGYIYDKSKGGVNGKMQMPPPAGTRMNCESAARIFMQLAMDMGIDGLQALYFKGGDQGNGYFVTAGNFQALGCQPEINSLVIKGWEFDNHWRVKDTTTGLVYDPTFGTSGQNPTGILGTSMETDRNFNMTTTYGEKYRIRRQGINVEVKELTKAPTNPIYFVTDLMFVTKQMTNLR